MEENDSSTTSSERQNTSTSCNMGTGVMDQTDPPPVFNYDSHSTNPMPSQRTHITKTVLDQDACAKSCRSLLKLRNIPEIPIEDMTRLQNDIGFFSKNSSSSSPGIAPEEESESLNFSLPQVLLMKQKHMFFSLSGMNGLSKGWSSLDASRPWILYWTLHSLDLMGAFDIVILNAEEEEKKKYGFYRRSKRENNILISSRNNLPKNKISKFKKKNKKTKKSMKFKLPREVIDLHRLEHKLELLSNTLATIQSCWSEVPNSSSLFTHGYINSSNLYAPNLNPVDIKNIMGGYGGGPGQLGHCAPNYAGILSFLIGASHLNHYNENNHYPKEKGPYTSHTIKYRYSKNPHLNSTQIQDDDNQDEDQNNVYALLDRKALYKYFLSLKHPELNAFRMQEDGEIDTRGTYTVLAIASLLNILTPELAEGVADYLLSCQSYEGGFSGEPYNEAHGGYVFCAYAGLMILNRSSNKFVNIDALKYWLTSRQLPEEGGFQGRTNKLVDGCYSFWQAATCALVKIADEGMELAYIGYDRFYDEEGYIGQKNLYVEGERNQKETCTKMEQDTSKEDEEEECEMNDGEESEESSEEEEEEEEEEVTDDDDNNNQGEEIKEIFQEGESHKIFSINPLYNSKRLQEYLLYCCQSISGSGLRDKPGKSADFYHTCYCLSGLSIAQWGSYFSPTNPILSSSNVKLSRYNFFKKNSGCPGSPYVVGSSNNLVHTTNPIYNIRQIHVDNALSYFIKQECSHDYLMS